MIINKIYNLIKLERKIYNIWEKNFLFYPNLNKKKEKSYSIIMPPPNITGNLHIGHAFQQTIMDIIARYKRMIGKNVLWVMGTDHAGIATQIIVENYIRNEKCKNYYSDFYLIKQIYNWKKKYESNINEQTRILGSSVNWLKTNFSLDKNFSYAVNTAFISLYNDNYIYKDNKIVYLDKKIKTFLSDIEVDIKKKNGKRWYIKYPILDSKNNEFIIVCTTRPETILGDVALAVNPNDKRYINFINKKVLNPLNNNVISIICDNFVNPNKGSGCVRITPANDFNDFKIAKNNKLNIINFLNLDGTIKEKSELYNFNGENISKNKNLLNPLYLIKKDIRKAKYLIIELLYKNNYIYKTENCLVNIPFSNRTNSIVEPLLTNQWFLRSKNLFNKVIYCIKKKKIKIYPKKYINLFFNWMENVEDWCISRQIIWGHRFPVWYYEKKDIFVGYNKKYISEKYKLNILKLKRDKNVLDTWFSSSLWPFVSLGWPKKSIDFNIFYPIDLVVSGFDIIFYWISRMIMMSLYLTSKIPFKKIFITGLIRDKNNKKMSKSIGNVIDPIDVIKGISLNDLIKKRTNNLIKSNIKDLVIKKTKIEYPNGIKSYGTDSLRFALSSICTQNNNINFSEIKLKESFYLCNKLWNVFRYLFFTIKENIKIFSYKNKVIYSLVDFWILNEFNNLLINFHKYIGFFRFDLLSKNIFNFIKSEFCDWYIEFKKLEIKNRGKNNSFIFFNLIKDILKLVHPILPFITEYFWNKIKKLNISFLKKFVILEKFPKRYNIKNECDFFIIKLIKKIVSYIRKILIKICNKNYIISLLIYNISFYYKKELLKNIYLFYLIKKINKIYIYTNNFNNFEFFSKPQKLYNNIKLCYKINYNKNKKSE